VDVDGRAEEVELITSGDALPTPASAEAPKAPNASRAASPSTVVVLADANVRLRVETSPAGEVTIRPATPADARILGTATPEIVVSGSEGDRTVTLEPLSERGEGWRVRDAAVASARGELRVRVTIDGKAHEAPLVLREDGEVGTHGGAIATFGDGAASLEVVREADGSLLLYAPNAGADGTAVTLKDAPTLVVETSDGPKTLTAEAVSDVPGAWRVRGTELREKDLRATLRIRHGGRNLEAPLPAGRTDLPKPEEPKMPEEIGATPTTPEPKPAGEMDDMGHTPVPTERR
jgi:hypothetical protein